MDDNILFNNLLLHTFANVYKSKLVNKDCH
jgi:hypothetical protein